MIYLDGETELTNLTIGQNITVVIDAGQDLDDSTSLAIKTCTLSSNGNSIDFIKNGLVPSYFTQMVVPLNSTLNREVKFNWKVFQVGNLATATLSTKLSCKIKLTSDNIDANSDGKSVLLLHQQTAVLRSLEGEVLNFEYSVDDDSYANGYCSIVFNNENFILG